MVILLSLSACFSVKPAATRTKSKAIETFYLGTNGNQYFIKPLEFVSNDKQLLLLDITIRYNDNTEPPPATINFTTFESPQPLIPTRLQIVSSSSSYQFNEFQKIFGDKNEEGYSTRYSVRADQSAVNQLLGSGDWEITLFSEEGELTFFPTRKSEKSIREINSYPFLP
jgi:hypothetical protein